VGPLGQREEARERCARAGAEGTGEAGPRCGTGGERRREGKRGPRGRERESEWAGVAHAEEKSWAGLVESLGCLLLFLLLSFSFSILNLFTQIHLNAINFELKP
jgi:hypothetical protein